MTTEAPMKMVASDREHFSELLMQLATHTPIGRLAGVEQHAVINWLIDGGHITLTGKPLRRDRRPPPIVGRNPHNGAPIYEPGADHTPHEMVARVTKPL